MIDEVAFKKYGLTELLKERGLYRSVMFAQSYSLSLVQELYNNLSSYDKAIYKVYILGKWIHFFLTRLNIFLEFKFKAKKKYEERFELNKDVINEITRGRTKSLGVESRLQTSIQTAMYNMLFKLGIHNWLPTIHNSSIVKEMALLLFTVVTRKKFNLGRMVFPNIMKEAD